MYMCIQVCTGSQSRGRRVVTKEKKYLEPKSKMTSMVWGISRRPRCCSETKKKNLLSRVWVAPFYSNSSVTKLGFSRVIVAATETTLVYKRSSSS